METERPGPQNKEDGVIPPKKVNDDNRSTRASEPTKIIAPEAEKKKLERSTENKHPMEGARVIKGRSHKTRSGRGFSLRELNASGVSLETAKKSNMFIDIRRSTKHEENVKRIKAFFAA